MSAEKWNVSGMRHGMPMARNGVCAVGLAACGVAGSLEGQPDAL